MKKLVILLFVSLTAACAGKDTIVANAPEQEFQHCTRLLNKKHFEEAVSCFESVKSRYPGSISAQEAELRVGDAYFEQKEYLLAAESFHAFIELYPSSPKMDYALYRAGLSYFKESPKAIDRDQQYLQSALDHFESLLSRYPRSAYRGITTTLYQTARGRIAKRQFYIGRFYFRSKEYIAAATRLQDMVADYPESPLAPEALYLSTVANLKTNKFDAAKDNYSKLSMDYANTPWTERAKKKLLSANEKHLRKNKESL